MAPRITYKRRHAYATRSNKIRKLRLPGGGLGIQYVKKTTKGPQTPSGDAGRINGVRVIRALTRCSTCGAFSSTCVRRDARLDA
mmetsp:Transcript_6961/g.25384  ORF Transcript_6961/g.25384 Transcript_6961/m.25384 type:complete len:84 (+) Transcript_6961:1030-1281(+)